MKWFIALLVAALAGCSATTRVNVAAGTGGAVPPPGSSVSGGSVGVHVEGGSALAALVAAGTIAALVYGREDTRGRYAPEPWSPPASPELLEGRAVNEQDCTRPIKEPTANLRCR